MTFPETVDRPFSDVDSNTRCAECRRNLSGRQVVRTPFEYPDDVFCDLDCAREYHDHAQD